MSLRTALASILLAAAAALASFPTPARASVESARAQAQPATNAAPTSPAKESKADKDAKAQAEAANRPITGRANRVAILNFGGPSSWNGKYGDMVGVQVNHTAFKEALPLLEKDKVDTVIIRINSGGGYAFEVENFHKTFAEYKSKFRTAVWVESAISAAAMSPWVVEEFYMMPEGNVGAATMWSGNLVAAKGIALERVLMQMESASEVGKKDAKVMRAMQIMAPLSANIDENGQITFFQDTSGQYLINPEGKILTLNAADAVKFGVAKGIASTKEELVKLMGLTEVEWAGDEATKLVDRNIRENDRIEKQVDDVANRFNNSLEAARSMQGARRRQELGVAKQRLAELRRIVKTNPTFGLVRGIDDEWFVKQEDTLRELGKGP